MPRRRQKASKEPSAVTSPGLRCPADCSWQRSLKALTETQNGNCVGQVSELITKIVGQQHSGPLTMEPQTEEQRGNRACSLTASGSISKAMEGLVGGAAQGLADCRQNWTTALIPRSSGNGTHPTNAVCAEGAEGTNQRGAQ